MSKHLLKSATGLMAVALFTAGCAAFLHNSDRVTQSHRRELSLDGTWEIAEGTMNQAPAKYDRKVPVPGLVSLAQPAFVEPGPKVKDRREVEQKDPRRDAFWYRRTFRFEGAVPPVATLKVSKAMFGTRLFLNGQLIGDHLPCFTPGYFDVRRELKTGENEVVIRVGADRNAVTRAVPSGFDFEKDRYIPGIFDSVSLILSGTPHFLTVQAAPDITNQTVRVQVKLRNDGEPAPALISFVVREAKSGRAVGSATNRVGAISKGAEQTILVNLPIEHCQLWSPENPFLYTLHVDSETDSFETRFGMRDFRFDTATGRAVLNGKPYFMRGSNITLYRFFEDSECGDLPWQESWVRRLHQKVKDMNWNSLRYCIGFPPEFWYRIADEEGVLIQDEFPIWFGPSVQKKFPAELKSGQLALEYAEWMRVRWNHPSVVIWDANNETATDQTGPAIRQVRGLDLSNRPWDNGYEHPQEGGDMFESHPYHFVNPAFKLTQLAEVSRAPQGNVQTNDGSHAVVINEYGWLWLNRDGTPTTLTSNLYQNLLGTNSTTQDRRHLYARYLAGDTEFWRCHRQAAGVLHFTALGYSRPDGQTSDHWLDVKKLEWEPEFYRYVKDAFEPVGLMIDFWRERIVGEPPRSVPVVVLNDLPEPWAGPVTLRLKSGNRLIQTLEQPCRLDAYGRTNLNFSLHLPATPASYNLEAELPGVGGRQVKSLRDFEILDPAVEGVAFQKQASASSTLRSEFAPSRAVDGNPATYWSSEFSDPAWLQVDLGKSQSINRVRIDWQGAFAKEFVVAVSEDGQTWTEVYSAKEATGGVNEIRFEPQRARWVKVHGTVRGTKWGYAVRELRVFAPDAAQPQSNP